MNKRLASTAIACLLLLAGCNKPAAEENKAAAPEQAAPEENYQARVAALPQDARNDAFSRAVRDAGRPCAIVKSSAPVAPINGAPAWQADCDNGTKWVIVVGKSGLAVVTDEAELRANGLLPNQGK